MTDLVIFPCGVLSFWFEQSTPRQWFSKNPAFDREISQRFGLWVESALSGELDHWSLEKQGCLALILVLDQFTRQIYRDTPKAFAGDGQALTRCEQAVQRGWVGEFEVMSHRQFVLMPMMHSEDVAIQRASLPLFEQFTDANTVSFAKRHCEIIERFGRFPHRNAVLGRDSTQAEIEFLKQPGSSF